MPVRFRWEKDFKDTEIGKIPKDWEVRQLKKDYKVLMGQSPSSEYYNSEGEGLPFAQGNIDFEDIFINPKVYTKVCYKIAPANSLLITVRAPVGEVNLTKKELCIGRGLACIFSKTQEDNNFFTFLNRYMFYVLKALKDYIQQLGDRGTTYQSITRKELEEFEYPSPNNYEEQSRIAEVLSWFDELIEVKKKQNEILEKTAMAIFKSWFIDFEPFKDKEFVYSEELGREIPKGWEVKPIGDIADIQKGISYKGSEKFNKPVEGSYVFITLDNFIRGGGFKTEYSWIKSERIKEHQFVKEGDLIIANTDMTQDAKVIGSPAIVIFPIEYTKDIGVYSHHVCRINTMFQNMKFYLYLLLRYTQQDNASYSTGTNVLGLDLANFKRNKYILLPPSPILQKFHSLVQPLFEKIINNQKEIMILKKVRDTLLPLLVFGKLRVEEI
ncbi:restriction endonuclease subunit S [Aquifex pyrophilus]